MKAYAKPYDKIFGQPTRKVGHDSAVRALVYCDMAHDSLQALHSIIPFEDKATYAVLVDLQNRISNFSEFFRKAAR